VRILRVDIAEEFAAAAADLVAGQMQVKPNSVLALPTGNTPLGLYAELLRRSRLGLLSLAEARIFDLDEYLGVAAADQRSYAAFLQRHLIAPLELDPARVRLLRGDAADPAIECREYEAALRAAGGIDLCILGLGANGHIAFNEPGSSWDEHTHVVALTPATRTRHAEEAGGRWQIPTHGLTLGIANILAARQVLLLIAGANKAAAGAALHAGVEDREWPVTSLLRAPRLTVIELSGPAPSR
jgi:glucosamine-6-phosphate deaminase